MRGTSQIFSSNGNIPMAIANLCHLQHNILRFELEYLKVIFRNLLSSQTLGKVIISVEGKPNLKNALVKFIKCKNC